MTKKLIVDGRAIPLSPWGEGWGEGLGSCLHHHHSHQQPAPSPGAELGSMPCNEDHWARRPLPKGRGEAGVRHA